MNIIGRLLGRDIQKKSTPSTHTIETIARQVGIPSQGLKKHALGVSSVLQAVRVISNGVAVMPISLKDVEYDKSGLLVRRQNTNHELSRLFSCGKVNPYCSVFNFIQVMTANAVLHNNSYAWIDRGATGQASLTLWPLDNNEISVSRIDPKDPMKICYNMDLAGGVIRRGVPAEEILHLNGFNFGTLDQISGSLAPLSLAEGSISLLRAMRDTQTTLHANAGQPTGALVMSEALTKESSEIIREKLSKRYSQRGDGGISLLDIDAKWLPFNVSFRESQLVESHGAEVLEIARYFNVSPVKLFDTNRSMSGTNADRLSIDFVTDTLLPWVRAWEASLDVAFNLQEQGLSLIFDESALLRTSKKDLGDYIAKLLGSGGHAACISPDEARQMLGLNPIGGEYSTPPKLHGEASNASLNQ